MPHAAAGKRRKEVVFGRECHALVDDRLLRFAAPRRLPRRAERRWLGHEARRKELGPPRDPLPRRATRAHVPGPAGATAAVETRESLGPPDYHPQPWDRACVQASNTRGLFADKDEPGWHTHGEALDAAPA